jgi:polyvinyl alcohol dehydrogenase (cytochrome)
MPISKRLKNTLKLFSAGLFLYSSSLLAGQCEPGIERLSDPLAVINGWGINNQNHRFIAEEAAGITPQNIDKLKLKWVFALPDSNGPRFSPLVTNDTVIISNETGLVYALDRATGCEKWVYDAGDMVRTAIRITHVDGLHILSFGTSAGELVAVDFSTGEQRWRIRPDEHPNAMLSGSSAEHKGVLYQPVSSSEIFFALSPFYRCCTFRGALVAIDVKAGERLWRAYTITQEASVVKSRLILPDHLGPSGAPIWSQPTLDLKRERIYVGTGENYSSPATDTSDAILAFDMNTGALIWQRQLLAGDAWNVACIAPGHPNCPDEKGDDLDFGAPPILAAVGGRDYILAGQKSGRVFALDPDQKGALLWSQKPGAGGKAGGIHFGMAIDPARGVLYVPISDREVAMLGNSADGPLNPSLHAYDIVNGEQLWETPSPADCLDHSDSEAEPKPLDNCFPGFSAAATATEQLVFSPTLDGVIRAFDTKDGRELWSFNTAREFAAVNGDMAQGGAIDLSGVYLNRGQLFVSSGYGLVGQMAGNAFMVLEVVD